jgi:putative FmdB family regulatory protein
MPTYDYKCECGKMKEVLQGMKEDPEIKCECGKVMQRQMSAGCDPIFKGSGFHCNDYSNEKMKSKEAYKVNE